MFTSSPMKQSLNRIEKIWLANAILFVLLFLCVSYFNRFAEDDFLFSQTVQQKGIVDATVAHYQSWNTRWLSIAWLSTWYFLIDKGVSVFVFNWFSLLFMIICFYRLFIPVPGEFTNHVWKPVLHSILFCAGFFFCTFSISDTWFWINSTTMYLWNIGFACLGLNVIVKEKKLNFIDFSIVCVAGVYIGAASEPFAITLLLTIPLLFLRKIKSLMQIKQPAVILFWISMLMSFAIAVMGSGHSARSNLLPHTSLVTAIETSFYFTTKILCWHFPIHCLPLLLFSSVWFYLGYINKTGKKQNNLFTFFAKGVVLIFLLTFLNTLPIVYLMGDYGPSRAWAPVSFYCCIISTFLFYKAGQQSVLKFTTAIRLFETIAVATFLFLVVTGIYQIRTTSNYAKAYDHQNKFNELPQSGWIHSAKAGANSASD